MTLLDQLTVNVLGELLYVALLLTAVSLFVVMLWFGVCIEDHVSKMRDYRAVLRRVRDMEDK